MKKMTMNVSIEGVCGERTIIDIRQTALKRKHVAKYMSDWVRYGIIIVSVWHCIGNATALKVLMGGRHQYSVSEWFRSKDIAQNII